MVAISSVQTSDQAALTAISQLHLDGKWYDLDPTYSQGEMYRGINEPLLRYDLKPMHDRVQQSDCRRLPIADAALDSIVFDPPFMFGMHGQTGRNKMTRRFTMFNSWDELAEMYQSSLAEFHRILRPGGILAFKCQDYTDQRTTLTHVYVVQWAENHGFRAKDLIVMTSPIRKIHNPTLRQRHARKEHCYWLVFTKIRNPKHLAK